MSINWLPLSDRKNIDQLKLVFEEPSGQDYGGICHFDSKTLVIVHDNDLRIEATTIAHEYRHWLQYELNILPISNIPFQTHLSYDKAIRIYFRSSASEYDALRYQNRIAKVDMTEWWQFLADAPDRAETSILE